MRLVTILATTLFVAGCGGFIGSATRMSPEEQRVHTVSDTSSCQFIATGTIEEAAQHVHTYIKKNVVASGGDAYKVLSSEDGRDYSGRIIGRVTYETWDCSSS